MNFAFSEEQEMLRDSARRFLEQHCGSEQVRSIMETEAGYDAGMWSEIAAQGWQAMAIPEAYGGAGFSFLEQVVLMEEMGRALMPVPYLSSAVLAADVLMSAADEAQKTAHLPGLASGETIWTLAVTEPGGHWDAAGVEASAKRDRDEYVLNGTKSFVLDGHIADMLIVAARTGSDVEPEEGISLFVVAGDAPGVTSTKLSAMDQTRSLAEVQLADVRVGADALLGVEGSAWATITHAHDVGMVAVAAEQVGGAQKCLETAVEYAKNRVQFGRPIGSFQAIKHKCADMLVQVESAKSAAYYAAWATSEQNEEFALVAPLAKSYCSEAYFFCAAENIQIHGGIGFTWEHDAHLYFKRAKSSELLFGDPAYQRSRLADQIGL
jgi:alkylation response protein AidB-like acyl-CoA dehydrogenase